MATTKRLAERIRLTDMPEPKLTAMEDKKVREWQNELYQGHLFNNITELGHGQKHIGQSDIALMDRLLSDRNLSTSSTLLDQPQSEDDITDDIEAIGADEYIQTALDRNMNRITRWADYASKGEEAEVRTQFPYEDGPIGRGFVRDGKTGLIREYETDGITLSLGFDYAGPHGMTLKTAYPDLNQQNPRATITPTNRDLTPIIQATPTYQKASPIEKAYLDYIGNPQSKHGASYSKKTDAIYVNMPSRKDPSINHAIRLNGNAPFVKTTQIRNGHNEAIKTPLTKLRDKLYPKYKGLPYVPLQDQKLTDAFYQMCPQAKSTVDTIQKYIEDHLTGNGQRQKELVMTPDIKAERIAKAIAVSDNIQPVIPNQDNYSYGL